jgi:hypothetical protein
MSSSFLSRSQVTELKLSHDKVEQQCSTRARRHSVASTVSSSSVDDSSLYVTEGRVRFDVRHNVVIPMRHNAEIASDERLAVWHNQESFDIINGANNIAVQLMQIGRENPEDFGHCYRGLENRLPANRKLRDGRIDAARDAVLQEQARQRSKGVFNASSLRTVYRKATICSIEIAMEAAELDAQSAAVYQKERSLSSPPKNFIVTSQPASGMKCHDEESVFDFTVLRTDDDSVSILSSDEDSVDNQKEGKGMMDRFKKFVNDTRNRRTNIVA